MRESKVWVALALILTAQANPMAQSKNDAHAKIKKGHITALVGRLRRKSNRCRST